MVPYIIYTNVCIVCFKRELQSVESREHRMQCHKTEACIFKKVVRYCVCRKWNLGRSGVGLIYTEFKRSQNNSNYAHYAVSIYALSSETWYCYSFERHNAKTRSSGRCPFRSALL